MHFACKFGSIDLVKLLLDYGADPLAVGYAGETVLQVAEDAHVAYSTRTNLATLLNEALEKYTFRV